MATLGWHWMAHATGCPLARIDDVDAVRAVITAVVDGLGLCSVCEPTAERTESGVTAVVLLAESHLAIHTLRDRREAFVDLFSCTPIDRDAAQTLVRAQLGAQQLTARLVERGT